MISNNLVSERQPCASAPPAPVYDTPVSHIRLDERSSIPSMVRFPDSFAITRLESSIGLAEPIVKTSSVPALLVAVAVTSLKNADYRFRVDERLVPTSDSPPFRSTVVDLDARPTCWVGSPFDYLLIHVPRKGLDDIAADLVVGHMETCRLSVLEEDLVLTQLTKSILPYIGRPGWPGPLTLDHLNLILGAHLLQKYAGLRKQLTISVGGLGPWQKRRATELLRENLAGRIRLPQLAQECGLSVSHFARSFKATFGVTTHRWLVQRRIERSQELLIHTLDSLADIADLAGFADQAAFTRTFHQVVGHSPGRWRRDQRR